MVLDAEVTSLGSLIIPIERVSSPDVDLSWSIVKPKAYNQVTASPIPFIQVTANSVKELEVRGADRIPYNNLGTGLEKLSQGEYFVVQFIAPGRLGKWMIPHKILGDGGHVQARFAQLLFSDNPNIGVARIARNVSQNKYLDAEEEVVNVLNDRPEVAKFIDSAVISDGRKVNIVSFFDLENSHFIPRDWHFVPVDDLSPSNLLKLVQLENYARKKWAERGVHYVDWQDEEPLLFQNGLEHASGSVLRSFLAMDFSSEVISDSTNAKFSSALNFYHLRVLPLLSKVFAPNPSVRFSTLDMLKPIPGNTSRSLTHNLTYIKSVFDPSDQIITAYSELISQWENQQKCIEMLTEQIESSIDRAASKMHQVNTIRDGNFLEIE